MAVEEPVQRVYGMSSITSQAPKRPKVLNMQVVASLPDPNGPTPRRRRTVVCSNLTVQGEVWDLETARKNMKDTLKGDKADLRCLKRPGVRIAADWAIDVCLSSWCRNCPFGSLTQ